jgi:hypothetical protein
MSLNTSTNSALNIPDNLYKNIVDRTRLGDVSAPDLLQYVIKQPDNDVVLTEHVIPIGATSIIGNDIVVDINSLFNPRLLNTQEYYDVYIQGKRSIFTPFRDKTNRFSIVNVSPDQQTFTLSIQGSQEFKSLFADINVLTPDRINEDVLSLNPTVIWKSAYLSFVRGTTKRIIESTLIRKQRTDS